MPLPTVLVVDPNPSTLRRTEEALAGHAYQVLSARDADEALNSADQLDLAVVLAAAALPRGNGYDLARAVRERWPAAVVVLLSGGFEVYQQARADESGVSAHLSKPFKAARLTALLEELIGPLEGLGSAPAPAPPPELSSAELDPVPPAPAAPRVPVGADRVATVLPRSYAEVPLVQVDPKVVGPALERAVMEVVPEVVEAVLRNALSTSPAFRGLVEVAAREAVDERLPAMLRELVQERIAALEAAALDADPAR
jgi:CheY-like chemotaxis protein